MVLVTVRLYKFHSFTYYIGIIKILITNRCSTTFNTLGPIGFIYFSNLIGNIECNIKYVGSKSRVLWGGKQGSMRSEEEKTFMRGEFIFHNVSTFLSDMENHFCPFRPVMCPFYFNSDAPSLTSNFPLHPTPRSSDNICIALTSIGKGGPQLHLISDTI